jgi:hypothetical protein
MAMICPQCSRSYEQRLECPSCGARLLFQGAAGAGPENQWQQTPWGRILIGLILAQGLAHGLQMATTAGLQASGQADGQTLWSTLPGLLLLLGLQGFSLLVGGVITGAGQRRGILYGSFVGLVNGLIFLFVELGKGAPLTEVTLLTQPIMNLAFGAVGGLIGTLIWKPLPTVRLKELPQVSGKARPTPTRSTLLDGPISWPRVVAGIAVVVCGIIWSQKILAFILDASEGKLVIATHLQAKLVTWEISAVLAFLGAGLAGATTANGLKQGLLVALGSVVLIAGITIGNPKVVVTDAAFMLASLACLTVAGGWFGCELFPPLTRYRRA